MTGPDQAAIILAGVQMIKALPGCVYRGGKILLFDVCVECINQHADARVANFVEECNGIGGGVEKERLSAIDGLDAEGHLVLVEDVAKGLEGLEIFDGPAPLLAGAAAAWQVADGRIKGATNAMRANLRCGFNASGQMRAGLESIRCIGAERVDSGRQNCADRTLKAARLKGLAKLGHVEIGGIEHRNLECLDAMLADCGKQVQVALIQLGRPCKRAYANFHFRLPAIGVRRHSTQLAYRTGTRPRMGNVARGIIWPMAAGIEIDGEVTAARLTALEARLVELGSLMVAYSGGVDSAFLAATAHRVLGAQMLAVLADSPSLARRDLEQARAFAHSINMPLHVVATDELERPEYQRNDANRCFHCKDELFDVMGALGAKLGFAHIAYGMNADDTRDYRPGQRAAEQHAVLAPLAEVGITKLEVRALAKAAGYPVWDRPAAPCLSSRVEYGRTVTREVLEQVERAEESMRALEFREFRVRHHGDLARVEIARVELPRALSMEMLDTITAALKKVGYQYVTLDCTGFRSGSMNAILPVEILTQLGSGRGA